MYIIYPRMLDNGGTVPFFGGAVGEPTLLREYEDFSEVFSKEEAGILASHADHDHAIDIEQGK